MKKIRGAVLPIIVGAAPSAAAHSASSSADIPGLPGEQVTANIWMQGFSNLNNCGDFRTSVETGGNPEWVKNRTDFHGVGLGVNLSGVGLSFDGSSGSAEITNDQGQKGAYISGNICSNITTVYIQGSVTGTALVNGNAVTTSASI